jgi:hypothetical protein
VSYQVFVQFAYGSAGVSADKNDKTKKTKEINTA